jgi:hypothetical protein
MKTAELPLVWYLEIFIKNKGEWLFGMWKCEKCGNGCLRVKFAK